MGKREIGLFPASLERNFDALTVEDQKVLLDSCVLVVGCGGLGGYVLEILSRIGVGQLIVADGDKFEESNLNRQILCTRDTLGKNKARVAAERISLIAPHCKVEPIDKFLDKGDLARLIPQVDIVVDASGGIGFKRLILYMCRTLKRIVVCGSVAGFEGFVTSVSPASRDPSDFFRGEEEEGAEHILGSPAPTVSIVATLQTLEVVSYLCWKRLNLVNKVLYISLRGLEFELLSL